MPLPLVPMIVGGAAIGAGLAAAIGPEEEPLWKRLLVGGALGGIGGFAGAGAGGAAAGGTTAGLKASAAGAGVKAAGAGAGVKAAGAGAGVKAAGAGAGVKAAGAGAGLKASGPPVLGETSSVFTNAISPSSLKASAPSVLGETSSVFADAISSSTLPLGKTVPLSSGASAPPAATSGSFLNPTLPSALQTAQTAMVNNPMTTGLTGLGAAAMLLPGGESGPRTGGMRGSGRNLPSARGNPGRVDSRFEDEIFKRNGGIGHSFFGRSFV